MAETKSERKVAVILATDVVGYSSMMEENEDQTLKNLKACRSIIEGFVNGLNLPSDQNCPNST